jgi:uncharacterized membrane-anchored protein YjiN (DUF445 family)
MRLVATGLLVLMLAVFMATSMLEPAWSGMAYPRSFAEAAIVGACADWFAVVALFRHPFGIPIPHTAIVPQHKKRIGDSLGQFIADNFLAPTEVTARLENVDAAGWLARWLKEPANTKLVTGHVRDLLVPALGLLNEGQFRTFNRELIRNGIDSIAAAPLAARLVSVLVAHGNDQILFDRAVDTAQAYLDSHRKGIQQRVAKTGSRWLPGWVDGKLTNAVMSELLDSLAAARASPDHPWRTAYRTAVNQLVVRLAGDPEMLDYCERIKAEVLDNSVVDGYLDWLAQEVESKVQTELATNDGMVSRGLEHALLALASWLDSDARGHAMVNGWARQFVLNTLVPNREEIGNFVAEVVARWDSKTFGDKLELQVGRDLQYIRINGTVVGGLVGLMIFIVSRMFG